MFEVKLSFGGIFASWFVQCVLILCMFYCVIFSIYKTYYKTVGTAVARGPR